MSHTQPSTPSQHKQEKQEQKEALAVLLNMYDAIGWRLFSPEASEEEKALSKQAHRALETLSEALYGEWARFNSVIGGLCNFCYLQQSKHSVLFKKAYRSTYRQSTYTPCCPTCFERFKAEQKILSIEVEEWHDGELTLREVEL